MSRLLALPFVFLLSIASAQIPDSYEDADNIGASAAELRKAMAEAKSHSFSRAWFDWEFLLRRYIDEGRSDKNALTMMAAHFRGAIFDRYRALEAKGEGEMFHIFNTSLTQENSAAIFDGKVIQRDVHGGGSHGGWGSHARMVIYEELVRQGVLSDDEKSLFEKIVNQSLSEGFLDFTQLERGANNRPFKNLGGIAAAVRLFPDLERRVELKGWIERQWREFTEYGDIFEVNHFPYGGLHMTGLMEIASETGKIKQPENRRLIEAVIQRYLLFNHGMGVRGNPNSTALANRHFTLDEMLRNPWHASYYGDVLVPDFWYQAGKEFQNEEYLWAAVQTSIGPEPPRSGGLRNRWRDAYKRRFEWFVAKGMNPKTPEGGSSVSLLSPTKFRIKERLYLGQGRKWNQPFTSFYLFDRNNEYMHCFDDAMGHLFEYCVDGAKLLGTSGKYNGIVFGQPCYDMLMVRHPDDGFPLRADAEGRRPFLDQAAGTWRRASCSLPDVSHSRTAPDSKNWRFAPGLHKEWAWRRTDDPLGGSAANMDGLVYLNNDYTLRSVTIRLNGNPDKEAKPDTVFLKNLRLIGPKGVLPLSDLSKTNEHVKITRWKDSEKPEQTQPVPNDLISIADDAHSIVVKPGFQYAVRVSGFAHDFDLANDYTRVSFDFKGISESPSLRYQAGWRYGQTGPPALVSDMVLNDRTIAPSHDVRGGILVADSVRAEDRNGDSFGSFTYRNYFGAHSVWQRDTILTREGLLLVRDTYTAGPETDGYRAGPIWCLRAHGSAPDFVPSSHDGKRNWFDAPAIDHAFWQTNRKRLLVYIHPSEDQHYGQIQHESTYSQEFKTNSSWAAATMKSGQPKVFLSVLVPFNEGEDPIALAAKVQTSLDAKGNIRARTGESLTATINAKGDWKIDRK